MGYECFNNKHERVLRATEEIVEAAQCLEIPEEQVHLLIKRVYSRPVGEIEQEIGGVGVTVLALCESLGVSFQELTEREVTRIESPEIMAKVRAKHNAKAADGVATFVPAEPVHLDEDGSWYFWNETWSDKHGPYDSKETAITEMHKYSREMGLGQ